MAEGRPDDATLSDTRQHYIPRLFLKAFARRHGGKKKIWVFTKGQREPQLVDIDDAAAAVNYYRTTLDPDNPDALDTLFKWAESRVDPVLDAIRAHARLPASTSSDWAILRRFLYDLMIRNPRMRQQYDPWSDEFVRQAISEWVAAGHDISRWQDPTYQGDDPNASPYLTELIHRALGHITEISDQTLADLHGLSHRAPKPHIEAYLDRRYWRLLRPERGAPLLITCDDPVVVHDDKGSPVAGLRNTRSRVTVVVSPTLALQGCYSPISNPMVQISALDAMRINWIMTKSAHREVFAREDSFSWKPHAGRTFAASDWFRDYSEALA